MMLDRMEGNAELKTSVQQMLATRRLTHSVLLVGEAGLGTGFAARCIAADYLYPAGGAAAEALLRGECCRAVAKAGKRDSGTVETGIVREAISVSGMGSGGKYLVGQVTAMRSEIFNTSLSAEGRAVLLYHVERMNEESANALLKVMEEPRRGCCSCSRRIRWPACCPPSAAAASALRWHRCPPPTAPATARRRAWTKKQLHCTVSCSMVILARCWRSPGTKGAPHRWKRRWSLPAPLPPAIATLPLCCLPPTKRIKLPLLLC